MKKTLNRITAGALAASALAVALPAAASITLFEHDHFDGRSIIAERRVENLRREGFNDRTSSLIVSGPRWERWEVCSDARFSGRCVVLRPGQYASLEAMGMNDSISSARQLDRNARIDENRYGPAPVVDRDFRRRPNERLFEADVVAVRAVVGPPQQRCWIEREHVSDRHNVPGAVAGAVIGGILGHQIGGGSGRDLATIGGVIGGAAVGANVNRGDGRTQEVQRCTTVTNTAPAFYDVTYRFRGQEHHAQLATPPGATILVNRDGEPRA